MVEIFKENLYKSSEWKASIEEGAMYEEHIEALFKQKGIDIGLYKDRMQYEGESQIGLEIKYDKLFRQTGNLYIEYAEKQPSAKDWVDSGIHKKDNSKYWLIGDTKLYFIFRKGDLLKLDKKNFKRAVTNTSKGILLPLSFAVDIRLHIDDFIKELKGEADEMYI